MTIREFWDRGWVAVPAALALSLLACGELPDEGAASTAEIEQAQLPITRAAPTAEVPWVVWLERTEPTPYNCSASILNRYWLLTAAHCVTGSSGGQVKVHRTLESETSGAPHEIYRGTARFVPHPDFDKPWWGLDAGDDIGLVFLPGGLTTTGPSVARIYADSRLPWTGTSTERQYSFVGWGKGTGLGGSDDCDDGNVGIKRMGTATMIATTSSASHVESNRGGTHLCPGDSGGAWVAKRGSSGTVPLQFGVSSGHHPLDNNDYAGLIHKKFDWMVQASRAFAYRLEPGESFTGGWRFLRFNAVSNPLPPPPPPPAPAPCPSGQICCEPASGGGCYVCVPSGASCL